MQLQLPQAVVGLLNAEGTWSAWWSIMLVTCGPRAANGEVRALWSTRCKCSRPEAANFDKSNSSAKATAEGVHPGPSPSPARPARRRRWTRSSCNRKSSRGTGISGTTTAASSSSAASNAAASTIALAQLSGSAASLPMTTCQWTASGSGGDFNAAHERERNGFSKSVDVPMMGIAMLHRAMSRIMLVTAAATSR